MFEPTPEVETPPIETKPDVFTLESLHAWFLTQPPEQKYSYSSPHHCACGQYISAMGNEVCGKERNNFEFGDKTRRRIFADSPNTFVAAAIRCRAAIEAQS